MNFLYKLSCSHKLKSLVHNFAILISQQSLRRQLTFFAAALFLCYASKLMLMHKASIDANSTFPAGVLM